MSSRLDALRTKIMDSTTPLESEAVRLDLAGGRWLAAPVRARLAAPPVSCSAMDGFAIGAEALAAVRPLRVAATVYAGDPAPPPIRPGEAVRIFTGAPVPENAAAVVPQEAARVTGDFVEPKGAFSRGANIRPAGEDVRAGDVALEAGQRLNARAAGLCAAVGVDAVQVTRRARVTIVSTGDEVVRGRTPDSNGITVAALVRELGAEVESIAVGDELGALEGTLRDAAARSDAVLTIGGVSVGVKDLVRQALARAGAEVRLHGVPMKPGKPFLWASLGSAAVFGLPGSPSACLVAFEVFTRPALLRMSGAASPLRRVLRVPLGEALEGRAGRDRFVWALLDAAGRAWPLGKDSAQIRGPAIADALLRVPEDTGDVPAGAMGELWLLDA
jgi:molybdopterin molybdotransferase